MDDEDDDLPLAYGQNVDEHRNCFAYNAHSMLTDLMKCRDDIRSANELRNEQFLSWEKNSEKSDTWVASDKKLNDLLSLWNTMLPKLSDLREQLLSLREPLPTELLEYKYVLDVLVPKWIEDKTLESILSE